MKCKSNVKAGDIHTNPGRAVKGLRARSRVTAVSAVILLMLSLAQAFVLAAPDAEQARKEREFQTCMRPAKEAFQRAVMEAKREKQRADRQADLDFKAAMKKAKHDAQRTVAQEAKKKALLEAKDALQDALRDAQAAMKAATHACHNPKPPETAQNDPVQNEPVDKSARACAGGDSLQGTLGHGPRGRNSVRMDLRVVDEAGKPVRGALTKLWSERQSNGYFCETVHKTGECGSVLMDPIHMTKTLQLKLEAKGFKPQLIQVDPAQLDRPFQVVMLAK